MIEADSSFRSVPSLGYDKIQACGMLASTLVGYVVLSETHPAIATSMNNLASTYGALGHHDEALKLQQEALRLGSGQVQTSVAF
jgi:hypothetical protein